MKGSHKKRPKSPSPPYCGFGATWGATGDSDAQLKHPDYYGPLASLSDVGGEVRFLVHSPVGAERIYYLICAVGADGRAEALSGECLVVLGDGFVYRPRR